MLESLESRIAEFTTRIDQLPETREPPPTTLQILGRSQQERDWQRLLFYFLSPDKAHGLGTDLLEQVLAALAEREDVNFTFSRFALTDIDIETEVRTSNGRRPDAVIWSGEDWFLCFELKLGASEGTAQTSDYVAADAFTSIELAKSDVPPDGHHYVYLAPDEASPPTADAFVSVAWEWIKSQLRAFLNDGYGAYPARTTDQLTDFVDTIDRELRMTEYQENQQEKARLYFEYYDEIKEAADAFDTQWAAFANNWGRQLVEYMDVGEPVEFSALRDSDVALDIDVPAGDDERWVFQQGDTDWAGLYKRGWWLGKDEFSPIYAQAEDKNDVRITFYHRLEKNREQVIRDNELQLTLTHGTGNGDEFMYTFRDKLNEKVDASDAAIPSGVSVAGTRAMPLAVTYEIPIGEYDDMFDAYIVALADAFSELVLDNRDLIAIIDETFEETLAVFD